MTDRWLFVDRPFEVGASVPLSRDAAHHVQVLRLRPGEPVTLFDGRGRLGVAELRGHEVALVREVSVQPAPPRVQVLVGLPRGALFDQVVRDLTEVGATSIVGFVADRSKTRGERAAGAKLERWSRIVLEAARQSEQAWVPTLELVESLAAVGRGDETLLAFDARSGASIEDALPRTDGVSLLFGPEGGLSDGELAWAAREGARRIRLHLPVLRVETAAVVGTAMVTQHLRSRG